MGFSTLSLYEGVWLDDQPVRLPSQTCLWLFSARDHKKIRLKGIWREVSLLMSLPNPWSWLLNSCNSWWKFRVVPLISARSGTCWKPFYFLCGLHTLFYFARKAGQGKGRRLWLFCSDTGHSKISPRHRSSMACITKHFGLYNQFFRSSSEKDVTLSQVMYSSVSPCLPSKYTSW